MYNMHICFPPPHLSVSVLAWLVAQRRMPRLSQSETWPRISTVAHLRADPPHLCPRCVCRAFPPSIPRHKHASLGRSGLPASALSAALCVSLPLSEGVSFVQVLAALFLSLSAAPPSSSFLARVQPLSWVWDAGIQSPPGYFGGSSGGRNKNTWFENRLRRRKLWGF